MTNSNVGVDIGRAVDILRSGGVVGLPTETVYGLGADASNAEAVKRIFQIKGRPTDHPLIVHVADVETARTWSRHWTPEAESLAQAFWPGPLTLIVERAKHVLDVVTGNRDTVALRCPSHPMMHKVLVELTRGVAAPSANRFGKVSPTTAQHVLDDLGSDIDYVLDGGPCSIGVESTIVDCTSQPPQILRPGGVSDTEITEILGHIAPASGPSRASGMLQNHYSPDCRVHPVESLSDARAAVAESERAGQDAPTMDILDASADPVGFATMMYSLLRNCDNRGLHDVYVVLPPDSGIGRAIRDRIHKAASKE